MPDVPINTKEATWRFVTVFSRSVVFVTFGLAGLVKLGHPTGFATDIRDYEVFPEQWTNLLAIWVPWIELIVALLMAFRIWHRETRVIIATLLVMFLTIKMSAVARGLDVECACFTGTVLNQAFSGARGIAFDLFLLGCLTLESIGRRRLRRATDAADRRPPDGQPA